MTLSYCVFRWKKKISIIKPVGKMIKACIDPHCEAVYHNCDKRDTKCLDCNGKIIAINRKTYLSKCSNNWFQYDRKTGHYYRPEKDKQLILNV